MISLICIKSIQQADPNFFGLYMQSRGARKCYIKSGQHGAYWRPDCNGYIYDKAGAGIYTFKEAYATTCHCGPEEYIYFEFLPEKKTFTMADFEKGLMLAGYISPVSEEEEKEKQALYEYETMKDRFSPQKVINMEDPHTSEPWTQYRGFIKKQNSVENLGEMFGSKSYVNAGRVVDCVNAMKGIENPIEYVKWVAERLKRDHINITNATVALMTARDALQWMLDNAVPDPEKPDYSGFHDTAMNAIVAIDEIIPRPPAALQDNGLSF